MANKIEKQKGVVIGFGIACFVMNIISIIFGILLLKASGKEGATLVLHIVFGIILILLAILLLVLGIRIIWVGSAIKATNGSISEENLAKGDGTNNAKKVCPKCGCTNTLDATECSNCHTQF